MKIAITVTIGLIGIAVLITEHYQQRKAKKNNLNGYNPARMYAAGDPDDNEFLGI